MLQSYRQTVWADRVDLISSHNTEADNGDHSYRLVRYNTHLLDRIGQRHCDSYCY